MDVNRTMFYIIKSKYLSIFTVIAKTKSCKNINSNAIEENYTVWFIRTESSIGDLENYMLAKCITSRARIIITQQM